MGATGCASAGPRPRIQASDLRDKAQAPSVTPRRKRDLARWPVDRHAAPARIRSLGLRDRFPDRAVRLERRKRPARIVTERRMNGRAVRTHRRPRPWRPGSIASRRSWTSCSVTSGT